MISISPNRADRLLLTDIPSVVDLLFITIDLPSVPPIPSFEITVLISTAPASVSFVIITLPAADTSELSPISSVITFKSPFVLVMLISPYSPYM